MNFDLFAEPEAIAATPAAAPTAPESFMMQPTGEPNRWQYRGVLVACNMKLQGLVGHWHTVEPLGCLSIVKSDKRVALCRAIDAHLGPRLGA